MGRSTHISQPPRGLISIDWMLLVVALIVIMFGLGSFIRIASETGSGRSGESLFTLDENEQLLAFQDFTFGAEGWEPALTSDRLDGLGPVLGPFSQEPVSRTFEVPENTGSVQLEFDMYLLGDWEQVGEIDIGIGDIDVATITVSQGLDGASEANLSATSANGITLQVLRTSFSPRRMTAPTFLSAPQATIQGVHIGILLQHPPETLVLNIQADISGDDAVWSLDNLTVIASR